MNPTANNESVRLITDSVELSQIVQSIADAGSFALDLEFVSESRYIPELALAQVAWGQPDKIEAAVIDCLAVDPCCLFELVASSGITTFAHSAKQDLGLLASRYQVSAQAFIDTQIAAAFTGLGDQIGYGKLIEAAVGISLDKGAQFTDWLARPLTPVQLRYAVNDVLYMPAAWKFLESKLMKSGRLAWVLQESEALAVASAKPKQSEHAYRDIKGTNGLSAKSRGGLRELAYWRHEIALQTNRPPSWILSDRGMIGLCRQLPDDDRGLRAIDGVGAGVVRRYGEQILSCLKRGKGQPISGQQGTDSLTKRGAVWAQTISNLVQAHCKAVGIAARFVATRADSEAFVAWYEKGQPEQGCDPIALLHSWRYELVGKRVLAWIDGRAAIVASREGPAALTLVDIGDIGENPSPSWSPSK